MGNPWQLFIKGWDGKTSIVNIESVSTCGYAWLKILQLWYIVGLCVTKLDYILISTN